MGTHSKGPMNIKPVWISLSIWSCLGCQSLHSVGLFYINGDQQDPNREAMIFCLCSAAMPLGICPKLHSINLQLHKGWGIPTCLHASSNPSWQASQTCHLSASQTCPHSLQNLNQPSLSKKHNLQQLVTLHARKQLPEMESSKRQIARELHPHWSGREYTIPLPASTKYQQGTRESTQ
jgi:hypothetical protein